MVVRIGLLHPGAIGAAIGKLLVARCHEVLWVPSGRSQDTAQRAVDAGLTAVDDLGDV